MVSENGRYSVKLQFMDKFYRVDVDDHFPICLLTGRPLLPIQLETNHMWSMLLVKALFKFFHKMSPLEGGAAAKGSGVGGVEPVRANTNAFYALTGFLNVEISLSDKEFMAHEVNRLLKASLSADNYAGNRIKIIALKDSAGVKVDSEPAIKDPVSSSSIPRRQSPAGQTRQIRKSSKFQTDILNFTQTTLQQSQIPAQASKTNMPDSSNIGAPIGNGRLTAYQLHNRVANQPVTQFLSYSIDEFFENGDFNLAFARDFTEEELIIHRKYEQMLNVKTHFMNKEDIIKLKKQRRDLRFKLKEIEKRKLDFITRSNRALNLVSVRAGTGFEEHTNYVNSFSAKEIQIAKTCMKYGLQRPPNFVDLNDLHWEEGSAVSGTKRDFKEHEQIVPNFSKSLGDFSAVENVVLEQNRVDSPWIETAVLGQLFTKLVLLYNPTNFAFKESLTPKPETDLTSEDKEVLIVKGSADAQQNKYIELLVNVQFSEPDLNSNHLSLQVYDFEKFKPLQELPLLHGINATMRIRLPNENQTFRIKIGNKLRSKITVYSPTNVKFCSLSSYIQEVEDWKESKVKVTTGLLCASYYYTLQKTSIVSEQSQYLIFHFPIAKLSAFRDCLKFELVQVREELPGDMNDRMKLNSERIALPLNVYENLKIKAGVFVLLVHCQPEMHISEQSFEFSIFSKKGVKAEPILNWSSGEIIDNYVPNKYGQIFKEDLYYKADVLSLSLSLEIKVKDRPEEGAAGAQSGQAAVPEKKSGALSNAKKDAIQEYDLDSLKDPESPLKVYIEAYVNGRLYNVFYGINGVKVLNFQLKKNIKETDLIDQPNTQAPIMNIDSQVLLIARFVCKNDPTLLTPNAFSKSLVWIMKLSANSLVCVVKNTKKEEMESNVIRSWESKEPGRAERAAKVRLRNLALIKQTAGEALTEKEAAALAEDLPVKTANPLAKNPANQTLLKQGSSRNPKELKSGQPTAHLGPLDFLENPTLIKPLELHNQYSKIPEPQT